MTTDRRDHRTRRRRIAAASVAAAALLVAACGSDDAEPAATGAPPVEDTAGEPAPDDGSAEAPATDDGGAVSETGTIDIAGDPLAPLEPGADPAVGVAAPVIDGTSFDGTPVTLGGERAQPSLLVFLAHWCPHCNDEIPELLSLDAAGEIPANVDVIGISTAVAPDRDNYPPSEWIVDKGWTWPVMADTDESAAMAFYGGSGFPFTVLLDADGTVLARHAGSRPADQIADWLTSNLPT